MSEHGANRHVKHGQSSSESDLVVGRMEVLWLTMQRKEGTIHDACLVLQYCKPFVFEFYVK
jgi:hypothetical protein